MEAGERVGSYRLLFMLGKGGMGEVWAAADERADRASSAAGSGAFPGGANLTSGDIVSSVTVPPRLVAIKVLARHRVAQNDLLLFRDEATAASALRHDSIVSSFELGEEGGRVFLAMELVQGPSLTALLQQLALREDRLEPAVVAHIGIQLARALDYAYTQAEHDGRRLRLIHRDVSPHNVLLDLGGRVRLTDFGVARTAIQDHESRVGTIRGKPSYMAPEQVAGEPIDGRTDLFALGIVLYECASLKRLFGRKSPIKSMDAVLRYTPRPLAELVPGFPQALSRVVSVALEKRPSQRYPSARALAAALEDAARDLPGSADARHRLAAKVASSFEPAAFDVESRARESLLRLMAKRGSKLEASPEVLSGVLPTAVWPTSPDPDPLDSDAIELLRTRLRPRSARATPSEAEPGTPGAHLEPTKLLLQASPTANALMLRDPAGLASADPSDTRFSARTSSGMGQWGPRRAQMMVALVATAATLAICAAGLVLHRLKGPAPRSAEGARRSPTSVSVQAAPYPIAAPTPRVSDPARPSASPSTLAKPETEPSIGAGRAAEAAEPSPDDRRSRRRGDLHARPEARSRAGTPRMEGGSSTPPMGDSGNRQDHDATYEEVRALVRRVRQLNPDRGNAMLATLLEAGRTNLDTLHRLRREARSFLETAPAHRGETPTRPGQPPSQLEGSRAKQTTTSRSDG